MSARSNALGILQRSTSQREQQRANGLPANMTAPALQRTASERARQMAEARLEGTVTPDLHEENSHRLINIAPSFIPDGAPPRLSALQRRHLEQQQAQAGPSQLSKSNDHDDYDSSGEQSPSFSIFTPSVINIPAASSSALARNPSVERQAARSNLIRKLSKRDVSSPPKQSDVAPKYSQSESETETISDLHDSPTTPLSNRTIPNPSSHSTARYRSDTSSAEPSPTSTAYTRPSSIATDAPSEFRPYRHTIERDRDSAFAQLMMEDQFEYASILNGRKPKHLESDEDETEEILNTPQAPSRGSPHPQSRQSNKASNTTRSRSSSSASVNSFGTALQRNGSREIKRNKLSIEEIKPFPAPSASYQFPSPPTSAHGDNDDSKSGRFSTSSTRSGSGLVAPPLHRNPSNPSTSQVHSSRTHGSSRDAVPQPTRSTRSSSNASQAVSNGLTGTRSQSSLAERSAKSSSGFDSAGDDGAEASDDEENWGGPLQQRPSDFSTPTDTATRSAILAKFSSIVAAASPSTFSKNELDTPPRKLLMHAPVLQVVNANTVKDRYLFLFNDILVIAKSLVEEDPATGLMIPPSLETKFLVKSIIELDKLKLTAQKEEDPNAEDPSQKKKHSLLQSFIDRFANDPKKAIGTLVSKGGLQNEPVTIANLLFRTTDLNRSQLGAFLCRKENKHVLKAYVDRFRLTGLRIEDALRVFIASLRLPNDPTAAEYLLVIFGSVYVTLNQGCGMEQAMCGKLVMAMMELNDYLHSGMDEETGTMGNLFGFPNPAISVDDFMGAFRSKDSKFQVPDATLTRVYMSIKRERVQQAADNSIAGIAPEIPVTISPARLPSRLTYRIPSEEITVTIPQADSRFHVKLLGNDAKFEPSVLNFAKSRTQKFKMTGTALGHKTVVLLRAGSHATYYTGLPANKTFIVERAFMRFTFQLAFVNHLGVKRKYMFSMSEADLRDKWLTCLRAGVENAITLLAAPNSISKAHRVANAVSLQVLRDALIAPEDNPTGTALSNTSFTAASRNGRHPSPAHTRPGHVRSNSFSKTYAFGLGRAEIDLLGSQDPTRSQQNSLADRRPSGHGIRRGSKDDGDGDRFCKSGNDIVVTACQNSHLPAVLSMLNAHIPEAKHPMGQ